MLPVSALITSITQSLIMGSRRDRAYYNVSANRNPAASTSFDVRFEYTVEGVNNVTAGNSFSLEVGGYRNVTISAFPVVNGQVLPAFGVSDYRFRSEIVCKLRSPMFVDSLSIGCSHSFRFNIAICVVLEFFDLWSELAPFLPCFVWFD